MIGLESEQWLEEINHKNIKISEPVRDLDALIRKVQNLSIAQRVGGTSLIFRGQGNAAHRLFPAAYRDSGRDKIKECIGCRFASEFEKRLRLKRIVNKDIPDATLETQVLSEVQIDFEFRVFRDFILEAERQAIPIPEFTTFLKSRLVFENDEFLRMSWPLDALHAALGLAQHYGIPTRFLDWTSDVFAALYFAASDAYRNRDSGEGVNFVLWILHTGPYQEVFNILKEPTRVKKSITPPFKTICVPTMHNQNLAAQQGLFVYCDALTFEKYGTVPLNDLVKVISSLDEIDAASPFIEAIRVPVTEAGALLGILDSFGCSAARYFPGLQGVVQALQMRGTL